MNNQGCIILLIIILSNVMSCSTLNQQYFNEGSVVISGEILGWGDNNESKTISVISNDLASGKQISFVEMIHSDGSFKFEFEKYNTQDIWLEYDNEKKTLFIHPGDSVYIRFGVDGFTYSDYISGDGAKTNKDIQAFFEQFNSFQKSDITLEMNELNPLEYKRLVYDQQRHYDSLLKTFVNEIEPTDEIENWANIYLDYRCAFDLINYIFTSNEIPDEYWEFINDYPVDNRNAVTCSEYLAYLEMYNAYLGLVQNKFDEVMKLHSQGEYYRLIHTYADTLLNTTSGTALDIMLTQFCYGISGEDFRAVDSFLTIYDSYVQNTVLKNQLSKEIAQIIQAKSTVEYSSNTNLLDLQNDEYVDDLFTHITRKYIGNVLYIDFWATWCSPCLKEMPYSQILHEEYEENPVVFIYLCSRSSTEKWKAIINKKNIKGEHYYLSNDQYNILQSTFQIQGIPHYMLVSEEGEIIETNAPRPSSEEIRLVLDVLLTQSTP